jgi:hypothetical protein
MQALQGVALSLLTPVARYPPKGDFLPDSLISMRVLVTADIRMGIPGDNALHRQRRRTCPRKKIARDAF